MDLNVNLGGLKMSTPVTTASGTFGYGTEYVEMANRCPIIVALGRSLYRKIPAHLQAAFDENRLLFVSFRDYSRPSLSNSQLRNWLAADLATEIVFAPFDKTSQLSTLHFAYNNGPTPCHILQ